MKRALLSWSTGKDSAWALHVLRLNERFNRVAMHATQASLLAQQAEAIGLPLHRIDLPDPCTDERYAAIMERFVAKVAAEGIDCLVFGDLFLEDVRQYREKQLAGTGIMPIFPLWERPTAELAEEMLAAGLEAYISCAPLVCRIAPRSPGRSGPLWRKWRNAHHCRGWTDVSEAPGGAGWPGGAAKRLRLR